jgi:hypothetical protein
VTATTRAKVDVEKVKRVDGRVTPRRAASDRRLRSLRSDRDPWTAGSLAAVVFVISLGLRRRRSL